MSLAVPPETESMPARTTRTRCGFASPPRSTKAPFTVAGKRSYRVCTSTGGRSSPTVISGPLLPRGEVLLLLRREPVDLDTHRGELQTRDVRVQLRRDAVHRGAKFRRVLHQVLDRERLVRERHVHDGRGMSLGGTEVHQATLGQQADA